MWCYCHCQNLQCHSQAVGWKRCDETTFHKMCNITHILLVIGEDMMRLPSTRWAIYLTCCWSEEKDVMRLPLPKCAMSLTCCRSYEKMWWDCLWQNVQCCSLAVGHRKRCDESAFSEMCNLCHSLPGGHRKGCDETASHKMCNVTHNLLVIRKDVMRLPFTKFAMPLTGCWSYEKMWWDCLSQNVQCYSHTVGHRQNFNKVIFWTTKPAWHAANLLVYRKSCHDFIAFHKICNITHNL